MPKPSDYYLSDEENAAIFERHIRPAEFGHLLSGGGCLDVSSFPSSSSSSSPSSSRPVCILLAGQTGAGKSHTAPALAAALRQGPTSAAAAASPRPLCHLVADTHKPYHPAYAGLVAAAAAGQGPPGLASAATGHDARRWLARACTVAAEQRCDALVESASRFPQDVVQMARTFRRAGYRVCLVMMAVHAAQSRLGLLARYLDAAAAEEPAKQASSDRPSLGRRLTPPKIHDESYAGLAQLAGWLDDGTKDEDGPLADAVLILRRGSVVAYANYWGEGTSQPSWRTSPPHISRTLAAERRRRDVPAETALFAADVARLSAQHPEREAELALLAVEYADGQRQGDDSNDEEVDTGRVDEAELRPLDPAALIARLRRDW